MKIIFLVWFFLSFTVQAEAFIIKVFAEPVSESAALEFITQLNQQEPFKQLIAKKIVEINSSPILDSKISCRGGNLGIPRLAQCELSTIKNECGKSELCPVFTKVPWIGAGGPKFPIVNLSFPWSTMLHEVVHTFCFTYEYAYTSSEVGNYCSSTSKWHNGFAKIGEKENVFETESELNRFCKKNIPWCKQAIAEDAVNFQKNAGGKYVLGSPLPEKCPSTQIGIFRGGSCQALAKNGTYRLYYCPTVMGYPSLGEEFCFVEKRHKIIEASPNLIPNFYQKVIFDQIISATRTRKVEFKISTIDTADNIYGIPEVDRLSGEDGTLDLCKQKKKSPRERAF